MSLILCVELPLFLIVHLIVPFKTRNKAMQLLLFCNLSLALSLTHIYTRERNREKNHLITIKDLEAMSVKFKKGLLITVLIIF